MSGDFPFGGKGGCPGRTSPFPSKYGTTMKLLEVARILSRLVESIDIHGLARLHKGNPEFELAVKKYKASLQGRKKDLLKPFGLDDLDKFKENPEGFMKMVGYAVDSFREKKEQKALYSTAYENDRCLITMPKGPEGAAAAGSLCKVDGEPSCPWCVCVAYPENKKWWRRYKAAALFFVYTKRDGVIVDAACILLTEENIRDINSGVFACSQVETLENTGNGGRKEVQEEYLDAIREATGLDRDDLAGIFSRAFKAFQEKQEALCKKARAFIGENDTSGLDELLASAAFTADALGSLLVDAVKAGRDEMCRLLLKAGAPLGPDSDSDPVRLMMDVSSAGVCRVLLKAGLSAKRAGKDGLTPLMCARTAEICGVLLDAGVDLEYGDADGRTALAHAAAAGNRGVCEALLSAGANPDGSGKNGAVPLYIATEGGDAELCKTLLDAGANPDGFFERWGKSALGVAAATGRLDICKLLIDAGACLEGNANYGPTPLSQAVQKNDADICRLLIDAGAKVNGTWGASSLLHCAVRAKNSEMCRMLLAAGADVNSKKDGMFHATPLTVAAYCAPVEICKLLLDAGADVNDGNQVGETPLF